MSVPRVMLVPPVQPGDALLAQVLAKRSLFNDIRMCSTD